jgi:hypothetical protein
MKDMSNRAIATNIGLASSVVLCIVSTFLPWIRAIDGSSATAYDSYFSGVPETLLIPSGIILAAVALSVFKNNKATRILSGVIGILASLVIGGISLIVYFNDKGGVNSMNSYSSSSLGISSNGFVAIGPGNYLAMLAAVAILVFAIFAFFSGKSGKKTESKVIEA